MQALFFSGGLIVITMVGMYFLVMFQEKKRSAAREERLAKRLSYRQMTKTVSLAEMHPESRN